MTLNLPKLNQTGSNEWADVESNDVALKEAIETLQTEVAAISGITWYTPKVIATEESRENTSYGTLTTADEIKSVVLPENGLILVGFTARVKSSVKASGGVAIFLGENQVKVGPTPSVQVSIPDTSFSQVCTTGRGLLAVNGGGAYATTGQILGFEEASLAEGGPTSIFAAAGTYDISIKYKATSGSVTAKERKLWVAVLG